MSCKLTQIKGNLFIGDFGYYWIRSLFKNSYVYTKWSKHEVQA